MTEQNNDTESTFLNDALKYLRNKGKKNGLDLGGDNFEKNLKEIIENPNSEYADDVYLFDEIPDLKKQEEELNKQIKALKSEVDRLSTEINGKDGSKGLKYIVEELDGKKNNLVKRIEGNTESEDEDEQKGLEEVVRELEELRDNLEIEIDGNDEELGLKQELEQLKSKKDILEKEIIGDKSSEDRLKKDGLLKYKDELYNQIYSKDGLEAKRSSLTSQINHLTKKNSVVEKLAELRSEAISNQWFYYLCTGGMILLIILSSCFAYSYGNGIIEDITKITDKDSRDYFGMFLMKIPFSLMIITFISG